MVTEGPRVKWCIEDKREEADLHRPLAYLCERLKPAEGLQLVSNLSRAREIGGIKILPLAKWLDGLLSPGGSLSI